MTSVDSGNVIRVLNLTATLCGEYGMVLTHLSCISRKNALKNALSMSRTSFERHFSGSAFLNGPEESGPVPATPKKPRKTTKKYPDLPHVYTSPTGTMATPLKAWATDGHALGMCNMHSNLPPLTEIL